MTDLVRDRDELMLTGDLLDRGTRVDRRAASRPPAAAIIFNNAITYRDRRRLGWRFFTGLLCFGLICSIGAIDDVGVARALFHENSPWWLAGAAGAVVGAVRIYAMSAAFTWKA